MRRLSPTIRKIAHANGLYEGRLKIFRAYLITVNPPKQVANYENSQVGKNEIKQSHIESLTVQPSLSCVNTVNGLNRSD